MEQKTRSKNASSKAQGAKNKNQGTKNKEQGTKHKEQKNKEKRTIIKEQKTRGKKEEANNKKLRNGAKQNTRRRSHLLEAKSKEQRLSKHYTISKEQGAKRNNQITKSK